MKKLILSILTLAAVFAFAACQLQSDDGSQESEASASSSSVVITEGDGWVDIEFPRP